MKEMLVFVDPRFAVDVTLFECNAVKYGRATGGSVAIHEFLVSFILGGGGRADGVAEFLERREVQEMYELMSDDEREDLLSDLTRELQ